MIKREQRWVWVVWDALPRVSRGDRPRLAVSTVVNGEHGALLGQVEGLSVNLWPPDIHVPVAVSDRELNRNNLPIRSDRWETIIIQGHESRRTPRVAFVSTVTRAIDAAIDAGAEVIVHLDVRCLPGHRLLRTFAEHAMNAPSPGPVVWHAGSSVQLHVPDGILHPVSGGLGDIVADGRIREDPGPTSGPDEPWAECFAVRARDWATLRDTWTHPETSSASLSSHPEGQFPVPSLVDAATAVGGSVVQIPGGPHLYRQHPNVATARYAPGVMVIDEGGQRLRSRAS